MEVTVGRKTAALLAACGVALAVSSLVTPPSSAAPARAGDAALLQKAGAAKQVIIVTADDWSTSYATLRAYERSASGSWKLARAATPARLGWNGLAKPGQRKQGSGETPTGTYALPWAFGRAADPGTSLRYVRVDRNDAWTYNPRVPSTYNVFQTANIPWSSYGDYVEHLWSYGTQYDYVAVLDYNLPKGPISTGKAGVRRTSDPADTRAGGGIFLHVTNGRVTAGCIAVSRDYMQSLLRWMDPKKRPTIVIAHQP